MANCPKFAEMQKMFHRKSMVIVEVQLVVETQTITTNVNVVVVNVTTKSKPTKEHVFKDRKLRRTNNVADWEKEERLK